MEFPNLDASCKITPIPIDINREWDTLSPFEQLPQELVWEIIQIIPEAVLSLRLTSRVIKAVVDDYAKQPPRIMFIEDVELTCHEWINMYISTAKWSLFALGCILREYDLDSDLFSKYSKGKYADCVLLVYEWDFNVNVPDYVRDIIGKRIGRATLTDAYNMHIFSNFLDEVQYKTLNFCNQYLHDYHIEELLEFIKDSEIDELYFGCGEENHISNPEDVLLEISSHVKILDINHLNDCRDFFCIEETDWGELFMGMLSRKLEKLHISSAFPFHLQKDCIDFLRQHLPMLGKELCLNVFYKPACYWCGECRTRSEAPKCQRIIINCDNNGATTSYLTEVNE